MDEKTREFLKRLRDTFRIEAADHLQAMSAGLIEIEKYPGEERYRELIEIIFREAHSLKGAARSVDLKDVEAVCQPLEGAFSALKGGEIEFTPEICDLFHRAVNVISRLILSNDEGRTPADRSSARELIKQLADVSASAVLPGGPEVPGIAEEPATEKVMPDNTTPIEDRHDARIPDKEMQVKAETVRIPTARLDPIFLQAEEMILVKMSAGQRVKELKEIGRTLESWKAKSEKWNNQGAGIGGRGADTVWNETRISDIQGQVSAVSRAAEQDYHMLKRIVDDHLESMKLVMMLPIATLVEAFPKLIRDLARDQDKEADLVIHGTEIEIDKRILEELKDPLIHLLRNSVDHGIKKPEERARLNKTPKGSITLGFGIKDGRQLEILISDDGEGIDEEQVGAAAEKSGLITQDAAGKPGEPETLEFIFESGISTSPIITEISGRGLGLAIVREKVEKLGGIVTVETRPGGGTTFRILMPLTLSTFRGVLVSAGEHVFVLPTRNVERAVRVGREEIRTVENRETILLNGQILPLVRLGDALELSADDNATGDTISAVVIISGNTRIAFQVDEILDELQVLVKGLGKQLSRVRNIAGATVLGSGRVVPILNVPDLLQSALKSSASARPTKKIKKESAKAGRILVADDSITSRTLIKNILETAGYRITTAVDGAEAFTRVKSDEFDLVVSDVDMPRMNGFELTAKIRSDKKLGDLPVVLVTALETRDDREHGIEVGANAYIVKSSFDQSNLLEVVKRLL